MKWFLKGSVMTQNLKHKIFWARVMLKNDDIVLIANFETAHISAYSRMTTETTLKEASRPV